MAKITHLNERSITAEIPPDYVEVSIVPMTSAGTHNGTGLRIKTYTGNSYLSLPEGKWEILGLPKNLTEEQWKGIVKPESTFGYPSYGQIPGGSFQWYAKPSSSGMALLKSKGLNPESIIILIKQ